MPDQLPSPREMGLYVSLSQVGIELVAPIGLGIALDYYFGWGPWGAIAGAVLGLVAGMAHLVAILNRMDQSNSTKPRQDSP